MHGWSDYATQGDTVLDVYITPIIDFSLVLGGCVGSHSGFWGRYNFPTVVTISAVFSNKIRLIFARYNNAFDNYTMHKLITKSGTDTREEVNYLIISTPS